MKAEKKHSKPALTAVTAIASGRIGLQHDDCSILGSMPALLARLPSKTLDLATRRERLDIDAAQKDEMLEDLGNAQYAVLGTIKLIAKLVASQKRDSLDHDELVDLGFSLHGLAHIAQGLGGIAEQISEAAANG